MDGSTAGHERAFLTRRWSGRSTGLGHGEPKPRGPSHSILSLGLQAEHELPVHASGGIPVETYVRGGRMRVAPGTLKRLLQEQALPACGEEQRVDRANQEAHAKRLVTAVAQPHIHAESISARGGLKGHREVAKHHEARCVNARARL